VEGKEWSQHLNNKTRSVMEETNQAPISMPASWLPDNQEHRRQKQPL